ncbi:hypothetical protein POMI540_1346 [Schizosaccharomyces pombe]
MITKIDSLPKDLIRKVENGEKLLPNQEIVYFEEKIVPYKIRSDEESFPLGKLITLLVTSQSFILFDEEQNSGWKIPYETITLHAKQSKDKPYVYVQLEGEAIRPLLDHILKFERSSGTLHEAPSTEDETEFTDDFLELTLYVTDVDSCYQALCTCQSLHPDTFSSDNDVENASMGNPMSLFFDPNHQWVTAENVDTSACDNRFDSPESPVLKWHRTE